jgi:hypothetical protein
MHQRYTLGRDGDEVLYGWKRRYSMGMSSTFSCTRAIAHVRCQIGADVHGALYGGRTRALPRAARPARCQPFFDDMVFSGHGRPSRPNGCPFHANEAEMIGLPGPWANKLTKQLKKEGSAFPAGYLVSCHEYVRPGCVAEHNRKADGL